MFFDFYEIMVYHLFIFRRIFNIDTHVGMAAAGLIADARQLAEIASDEASTYRLDS